MKRILSLIIAIVLLIPACVFAEQEKLIELGPYTFDAAGSKRTSSGYDNILDIYYPAGEDGKEPNAIIWFVPFDESGVTLDDFIDYYGSDDMYYLSLCYIDSVFGPNSKNTYTVGYTSEDVWPYLNPKGMLFNSVYTKQYDSVLMAGALLISEEGVLGIECTLFGHDLAKVQAFRLDVLNKLSYSGSPVVQAEPDPYAPQNTSYMEPGELRTFTMGDYTFEAEGYLNVDDSEDYLIFVDYADHWISYDYYAFSEWGLTRQTAPILLGLPDDSDYAIAKFFYEFIYTDGSDYSALFETTEIENGETPLLFNCRYTEEYDSTLLLGAVVVEENGVMVIEVSAHYITMTFDDIDYLRSNVLDGLKYNGESVLPEESSVFADDPSHQFTSTTVAPKLKLGESFSFDLSDSLRDEDFRDDSMREHYPSAVARNITYDHGILNISFMPYEWYGSSREWLLKTFGYTDPEKGVASYIFNSVKASFDRFGSNFVADGPHLYGDHAYILFTGEYSNYGSPIYISGLIMTADDGVLVMIYYPDADDATTESSAKAMDSLLDNLRYDGSRLKFN